MTQLRGVIFDVDGTLVESNDAHAHAWVDAMHEHGYTVRFEQIRPLIGMGGDKVLPEMIGVSKESEEGKAISSRRKEIFKAKYLSAVRAFPQAKELLEFLHKQDFKLVTATSAEQDELDELLHKISPTIGRLFEQQASSKDAQRSKPDPDIMQAALKRGGLSAQESVMIGDTPYDIESSRKVDVPTIAFRCGGGWSDQDLAGAIAIYDGPGDLLKKYENSPLHN